MVTCIVFNQSVDYAHGGNSNEGAVINYWGGGGGRAGKFWGSAVVFSSGPLGWAIILWAHV